MDRAAEQVRTLREKTGVGLMDCKGGAQSLRRGYGQGGRLSPRERSCEGPERVSRAATEGTIAVYIHMGGKIATMVEVNCETDFVAKTDQFQAFAKDVAMQVTADRSDLRQKGRCPRRRPRERKRHLQETGERGRQARQDPRQDCGRQTGEVLSGILPHGPAVHKGPGCHDQEACSTTSSRRWANIYS